MLGRMRSLANFHPDLRVAALVAPRRAVTPRTLPVLRRLTKAIKGTDPDVHVLEPVWRYGISDRIHSSTGGSRECHGRSRARRCCGSTAAAMCSAGLLRTMPVSAFRRPTRCRRRVGRLPLAPEFPYPIPVNDCFQAYRWLVHRPEVDASKIVIGGASAGGGLAAALAFAIRDSDLTEPVFQLLVYPMLDDRTVSDPSTCACGTRTATASGGRVSSAMPML